MFPPRRRRSPVPLWLAAALSLGLAGCQGGGGEPEAEPEAAPEEEEARPRVTLATFNVIQLSREKVDEVDSAGVGTHPQLRAAARVVKSVDPDVLVLNEVDLARTPDGSLDRDDLGRVVRDFVDRYLATGPDPLDYPHLFVAPSNTGELSGLDLNRDDVVATEAQEGTRSYGDDSWGYGEYPGQYAMAVLSREPLREARARTFRTFRWADLPGNHLPRDFYGDEVADRLRLSSKSHWDLPVEVDGETLHLWVSHPTPPVFDGPENRNGRRNFDEIGFWVRYLEGSDALYDDQGREGGYRAGEPFVIAGDLNADPDGGDAVVDGVPAISQLLDHPRIVDPEPHRDRPTAEFGDGARVDYLLPSRELTVVDGGVVAPSRTDDPELAAAARDASDHYLVWLEVGVPRER